MRHKDPPFVAASNHTTLLIGCTGRRGWGQAFQRAGVRMKIDSTLSVQAARR
jgi:hypothetical protein